MCCIIFIDGQVKAFLPEGLNVQRQGVTSSEARNTRGELPTFNYQPRSSIVHQKMEEDAAVYIPLIKIIS